MRIIDVFGKNYKTGSMCKMKKNKKVKKTILKAVERIARNEVEKDIWGDPPICFGIGHQPKRPKRK
jgi:hypothetical protein